MMLDGKNAIIYGGAGALGAGVARTFVREGARVFLVGRTEQTLAAIANEIGARASYAVLDATDERAVDEHVAQVVAEAGSVDVSFNLTTRGDVQQIPLVEMSTEDLLRATVTGLTSSFRTARAATRQMIKQGSGVLLHLNSGSGHGAAPGMGSTGPADAAVEALMRYLAAENGAHGVRVCGIWTAGVAGTLTREKLASVGGDGVPEPAQVEQMIAGMSVLRRTPQLADVAETAAFLASDRGAGITGTMTNVTAGLVLQ